MADLNAHEAGNGGQGQDRPTAQAVLFYSESCENAGLQHLRKNALKSVSSSANECIGRGSCLGRLGGFDLDPFLLFTDGEQNPCIADADPDAVSEYQMLNCSMFPGHRREMAGESRP
jgi:hypothetical protein